MSVGSPSRRPPGNLLVSGGFLAAVHSLSTRERDEDPRPWQSRGMANVVESRVLLTKSEVAELLRVSERTVDRWRRLGVIQAVQPLAGGAARYIRADVEALLEPEIRPPVYTAREEELEWS